MFPAGSTTARTTTRDRHARGQPVRVEDPLGNATSYTYDVWGNRRTTTGAADDAITLSYDIRGRQVRRDDPDMGTWTYTYNALGELVSQTDAVAQTVSLTYDLLGRMTGRSEAEGTTSWTYDTAAWGTGKLHRVSGPGGYERSHVYDLRGRASSETVTLGQDSYRVTRSYDGASRVAQLTYPETGFAVAHGYTASGYLESVSNAATPATVYWTAEEMNAAGQITEADFGNGIGTTRTYDPKTGAVTAIQSGPGDTASVQDLGYGFDRLGNLTSREDFLQDVYETFTFDSLNRLTGATVYDADDDSTRETKSYRYDAIGNIVHKSDVGAADYVYGTSNEAGAGDAGPHAVVGAGGNTYAYDDNGNRISGAGRTLTWTSFNKPKTVVDTATSTTFEYDPERARSRQTKVQGAVTTTITYVGGWFEQVAKTGEATRNIHYIFARGTRVAMHTRDDAATPSTALRYLHRDHLGSVDTITDASGAVVERLAYDSFGMRRVASGEDAWGDAALAIAGVQTPRGFTDHEHLDDFVLVHMNGRVYDPVLGRFLSADPFIQFPGSTQGWNRYTCTHNNPLSFTDPSGYLHVPDEIVVIGVPFKIVSSDFSFPTVSQGIRMATFLSGLAKFVADHLGRVFSRADTESPADPIETPPQGAGGDVGSEHSRSRQDNVDDSATGPVPAQSRTVSDAVVTDTTSTLGGEKFANGADTVAFAEAT